MLERAVRALGEALEVDRVVVRLADECHIGGVVTQWVGPGASELPPDSQLYPPFRRLVSEHADREEALWIDDLEVDPRVPEPRQAGPGFECRAYAGVPLLTGHRLVGWMALHAQSESRAWSARDRIVAQALAHDLSGALLQAQAHQRQVDTVRELQQIDEVKNEFVWRVSHELRTPLTSIRGYTELLVDGEVGEPTPAQQRTLDVILRNCERLLSLTENLLSLSRVDAHEFQTQRDPVDLLGLLGRVGDRALSLIVGRRLDLSLPDAAPSDVALWGDEAELERVLVNLLANAVKFTPDGGRVELSVAATATHITFDVTDSGCGIDEEDHARVFERFFRTHQATESEVAGAGLGLALVESIVEAHGGTVSVKSEPGRGSRFRVVLPVGAD
jgi:signal transduction histidine kinase